MRAVIVCVILMSLIAGGELANVTSLFARPFGEHFADKIRGALYCKKTVPNIHRCWMYCGINKEMQALQWCYVGSVDSCTNDEKCYLNHGRDNSKWRCSSDCSVH